MSDEIIRVTDPNKDGDGRPRRFVRAIHKKKPVRFNVPDSPKKKKIRCRDDRLKLKDKKGKLLWVCNPKTGNVVKASGSIGKKILLDRKNARRAKRKAQSPYGKTKSHCGRKDC